MEPADIARPTASRIPGTSGPVICSRPCDWRQFGQPRPRRTGLVYGNHLTTSTPITNCRRSVGWLPIRLTRRVPWYSTWYSGYDRYDGLSLVPRNLSHGDSSSITGRLDRAWTAAQDSSRACSLGRDWVSCRNVTAAAEMDRRGPGSSAGRVEWPQQYTTTQAERLRPPPPSRAGGVASTIHHKTPPPH